MVEVDHPKRGKYLTVGNPIKLSDSPTEVNRSPLLGEHTEEILREVLGSDENRMPNQELGAVQAQRWLPSKLKWNVCWPRPNLQRFEARSNTR